MNAYTFLAPLYDRLTADVDYTAFAEYYEILFKRHHRKVETLLDLACGTGTLTGMLADRGYDMIGVDGSEEMLAVARDKLPNVLLLNQEMEALDLFGTVDAAICALDGANYLPPSALAETLRRVLLFLEPGGLFVFDVNTVHKLKGLDGAMFIDEDDDLYCVWRTEYDEAAQACLYGLDLFVRDGAIWQRYGEEHIEYAYASQALRRMMAEAGFSNIVVYGDKTLAPPAAAEARIFITGIKPESSKIERA